MGIAITLAQYLAERGVEYDVVEHPHATISVFESGDSVSRLRSFPLCLQPSITVAFFAGF